MIDIIPHQKRHYTDFGWLKTYWLFSFSDYKDPDNMNHGKLRVFNDDIVLSGQGFPTHPHREMEIITMVMKGEITHKDSMGNEGVIRAGDVQRMSAGTGLTHSEYNLSDDDLEFYQIWIRPDQPGLSPSYEQAAYDFSEFKNRLFPVASGQGKGGAVSFYTDASIYRSVLDSGHKIHFEANPDRKQFLYVSSGSVRLNDLKVTAKDQARISEETVISFEAEQNADFIFIDIPS